MISYITGTVKTSAKQQITLQVGGFGLSVTVADTAPFALGKSATVLIHVHWSVENGPSLYGFADELQRQVFILIIHCAGIGPKIALASLGSIGAKQFLLAIQTGDIQTLSKVNGIGTKKAEQIIVQLKHKIGTLIEGNSALDQTDSLVQWHTLGQALESLNYSRMEVDHALDHVKQGYGQSDCSFDQLLRFALSFLAKQQ